MFKKILTVFFVLLTMFFEVNAKNNVVLAKRDGIKIYQNKKRQLYEKPIYTAKKDEYMEIIKKEDTFIKVKLSSGKEGWVEARLVTSKKKIDKANYVFEDAQVQGYLDNPQAVYILDMKDPNFKPIKLDKSFSGELEQNVDKEESEESHGMYRPSTGAQ